MTVISPQSSFRRLYWPLLFACTLLLSACDRSTPSLSQITEYIENYQIVHDYRVASMSYEIAPEERGKFGSIQVSGQLELREPLYVEDEGNRTFRTNVAKMLRRNRFSEREINHDIYDRVIRASARLPRGDNEYYTFLKVAHEPGFAINFSANLIYKKGTDGFVLDGPLRHAKLLGAPITKFSNPVIDDTELVHRAVKNVLAEQIEYGELMKASKASLTQLWDNDFGFVVWNRKVPYLGDENLSANERGQLREFSDWRAVYHISNVKPVQYRTPRAANFFELGEYTTEGIATCMRQTGFIDELAFLKSKFDQYCEFGKQYPVRIKLSSNLGETNSFVAKVQFEVNGVSSGEFTHDDTEFKRERNELARYSDQQRLTILKDRFDISAHNRPVFSTMEAHGSDSEQLSLRYTGASKFDLAKFDVDQNAENNVLIADLVPTKEPKQAVDNTSEGEIAVIEDAEVVSDSMEIYESAPAVGEAIEVNGSQAKGEGAEEGSKPSDLDQQPVKAMTHQELVKAIQIELKRLGLYGSRIDGVAGEYTYWGMDHARKQRGQADMTIPSGEFLVLLQNTPSGSIAQPEQAFQRTKKPEDKKGTLAGKALKSTGRAVGNAARWVGNKFKKKEPQP